MPGIRPGACAGDDAALVVAADAPAQREAYDYQIATFEAANPGGWKGCCSDEHL